MYGEDIDLSYRIVKAGYKNYYFPDAKIIHYKGESTKRTSVNYVFVFYREMIIFAQKHFSQKNAGLFSLLIHIAIYLRAAVAIVTRFCKKTWLPVLDFGVIYFVMLLVTRFWEKNIKYQGGFYPDVYINIIIPIFAAAIVGGLGQAYGAIAGGLLIGFAESLAVFNWTMVLRPLNAVLPEWGPLPATLALVPTEYKLTVAFVILVVVLLVRPTGIFKGASS